MKKPVRHSFTRRLGGPYFLDSEKQREIMVSSTLAPRKPQDADISSFFLIGILCPGIFPVFSKHATAKRHDAEPVTEPKYIREPRFIWGFLLACAKRGSGAATSQEKIKKKAIFLAEFMF